ncbi:polysaccharide pyruvyl transferase family protein [Sphingobium sp. WCS2017Hpa-17]|uniref:polysaccharide pyruvyl transferase family protein n=1 Tax=Sphingobium sp. WCS2017Hpa-17 TaxID=3073638 RepID=UPI00288BE54C|nr:polysaccharide pyruvyl transferase family protein [Sphingobium sp. WCS2017Hpa-17]
MGQFPWFATAAELVMVDDRTRRTEMFNDSNIIVASWPNDGAVKQNWGDKLNPELINKLSGLPVANLSDVSGWEDRPVYRVIGSGLGKMAVNEMIWGMGFLNGGSRPSRAPARIFAVRGPKSRERLLSLGIPCPEVYGDPAVLYPLLYSPEIEKVNDFGIILHCRERNVIPYPQLPPSTIDIDINGDIQEVVRAILTCRTIISSSLHGIICAHAYGIPAYWLKASDLPLGDGFKFLDYFESIGCHDVVPTIIDEENRLEMGTETAPMESLISGTKLIKSCPFMSISRKRSWIKNLESGKASGRRGTIFR